jgi:hypothetical protein
LIGIVRYRLLDQRAVAGCPAHERVHQERGLRIADPPVVTGEAIAEGLDQQVQRDASA